MPDTHTVDVHIPADLAAGLGGPGPGLDRRALEALALAAYQAGALNASELRLTLGMATHHELDAFLTAHGVTPDEEPRRQDALAHGNVVARFQAFADGHTPGGSATKPRLKATQGWPRLLAMAPSFPPVVCRDRRRPRHG